MENLKIRVNNEEESKEAQELFLKYGATGNMCLDQSIRYVCTFNGALTQYDFLPSIEFKRITIPELRALVSLHKNPINMDRVLSEVRSDALGLLNDQYAEIEKVRQESQAWANRPAGRCRTVPINEAGLPDFLIEDTVNHPSHYASGEIECIDAIESSMTHEAFCGYLKGNVQKYMWRYENKGGLESLEKAQWYLSKLISRIG